MIVGADRYKACMFAKKHFDIDTIVLDDGFQHRNYIEIEMLSL